MSLRTTPAGAEMAGLAKFSNVALMERLQESGDWLVVQIGRTLSYEVPQAALSRPVRLVDGSVVGEAGAKKRGGNGLWRLHVTFALGSEYFDHLELTDECGGARLDRAPVVKEKIRIADRAYLVER